MKHFEIDDYELVNLGSEEDPEIAVVFYEYFRDEGWDEDRTHETWSIPEGLKEKIIKMAEEKGYKIAHWENGSAHHQSVYLGIDINSAEGISSDELIGHAKEIIQDIEAVKAEYKN